MDILDTYLPILSDGAWWGLPNVYTNTETHFIRRRKLSIILSTFGFIGTEEEFEFKPEDYSIPLQLVYHFLESYYILCRLRCRRF